MQSDPSGGGFTCRPSTHRRQLNLCVCVCVCVWGGGGGGGGGVLILTPVFVVYYNQAANRGFTNSGWYPH